MISNSKDFKEILKLEKVFEDDESTILLQMGYLKSGDYILYETFIDEETLTREEIMDKSKLAKIKKNEEKIPLNWGALITIKKETIASFNEKITSKGDALSKSFDSIIDTFKKEAQEKYTAMEEEGYFLNHMEQQIKIHDNNMTFKSYDLELMMQSQNINFIKESFTL